MKPTKLVDKELVIISNKYLKEPGSVTSFMV